MGNNNYQFRLQSLDVLDQYANKLKKESDDLLSYQNNFKTIHETLADSDEWNDIKHTEFFEGPINDVILEASKLRSKIEEAIGRLNQLKSTYANAGVS